MLMLLPGEPARLIQVVIPAICAETTRNQQTDKEFYHEVTGFETALQKYRFPDYTVDV